MAMHAMNITDINCKVQCYMYRYVASAYAYKVNEQLPFSREYGQIIYSRTIYVYPSRVFHFPPFFSSFQRTCMHESWMLPWWSHLSLIIYHSMPDNHNTHVDMHGDSHATWQERVRWDLWNANCARFIIILCVKNGVIYSKYFPSPLSCSEEWCSYIC